MTVRLFEHQRAIFYAPFYAAYTRGAYQAAGADVEFISSPSPAVTVDGLHDGTADVAWGGPMRVLLSFDSDPNCDLVLFAEAVTRDPFFLIGREPKPDYQPADLLNVRLATVSEVPTPWLCLQEDLRRAGIDPAKVDRHARGSMPENVAAFQNGSIDVVQVYQPFAEEQVRGGGHIWYAAASRGPAAYTSFFTTRQRFEADPDSMAALTNGLYKSLCWVNSAPPEAVAEAIAVYFPDVAHDLLADCIARYQTLQIWNQTPVLSPEGFERLKASCLSGGLISRDTPYDACVDNRHAEAVASDMKLN